MMNLPQTPGLHIPGVMGPTAEDTAALSAQWDTLSAAQIELAQEGFLPLDRPNFVFPNITLELLTSPNTREYTDAYRCSVAWLDYARDRVARTDADMLQMKNVKAELERQLRRSLIEGTRANSDKRPTVQEQADYVAGDPTYIDLIKRMQYTQQKELVYKSELKRYEAAVALLSRNVEIRREQWGAGNSNAGAPPAQPYRAGVSGGLPGRMP